MVVVNYQQNTLTALPEQGTLPIFGTESGSSTGPIRPKNTEAVNRTGEEEEEEELNYDSMSETDDETKKELLSLNNPDTTAEHRDKIASKHAAKNAKKRAVKAARNANQPNVVKVENTTFKQ